MKEPEPASSATILTVPNVICVARLVASPLLIVLAARDLPLAVIALFLVLTVSDWIDGKIAVLLDQRSAIGPLLDSLADLVMYASLLVAMFIVDRGRLFGEWPWLVVPLLAWIVTIGFSFFKFGRWPSVHTRSAKMTWGLAAVAAISFLGDWSIWPFRVACAAGVLANLHALAILAVLEEWRTDVPSLTAARRSGS